VHHGTVGEGSFPSPFKHNTVTGSKCKAKHLIEYIRARLEDDAKYTKRDRYLVKNEPVIEFRSSEEFTKGILCTLKISKSAHQRGELLF
jgi:hypothetical protein